MRSIGSLSPVRLAPLRSPFLADDRDIPEALRSNAAAPLPGYSYRPTVEQGNRTRHARSAPIQAGFPSGRPIPVQIHKDSRCRHWLSRTLPFFLLRSTRGLQGPGDRCKSGCSSCRGSTGNAAFGASRSKSFREDVRRNVPPSARKGSNTGRSGAVANGPPLLRRRVYFRRTRNAPVRIPRRKSARAGLRNVRPPHAGERFPVDEYGTRYWAGFRANQDCRDPPR